MRSTPLASPPVGTVTQAAVRRRSGFFVVLAALLALIVFAGFAPSFYLRTLFGQPELPPLLVVHGVVFSAWMLLMMAQTVLVRTGRLRLHRQLGIAGAVLAVAMVVVGTRVALQSAAQGTIGLRLQAPPLEFLIIPLGQLVIFAVLTAAAIALRRRSEAHKRLMFVATLNLVAPAAVRAAEVMFQMATPLAAVAVLGVALLSFAAFDFATRRRVHPVIAIVGPATILSFPLRIAFSHTTAWQTAAQWLVDVGGGT